MCSALTRRSPPIWLRWAIVIGQISTAYAAPQRAPAGDAAPVATGTIAVTAVAVPLNSTDPSVTAIGDFVYAGGLVLTASGTTRFHELSDMVLTGKDRITAVGDGGVLLEARLVLDGTGRLVGMTDARLTPLLDQSGTPLSGQARSDAEGLAVLPSGDRLVSFERQSRIWLYPKAGGPPRAVPSPRDRFPSNAGMEALTTAPDVGDDAYIVGAEESGKTWICRLSTGCVPGPTIDKPKEFGLVAIARLPNGLTAYLLRAYDPVRKTRIMLKIFKGSTVIDEMDMAPPLTVDNFEGLAYRPQEDGRIRFYLVSDDNAAADQRTLLLAFDWRPRR